MGNVKYAENLAAKNIAKIIEIESGTEVEFRGLVWVVALALGARYNYAVVADEKQKDKDVRKPVWNRLSIEYVLKTVLGCVTNATRFTLQKTSFVLV